MSDKLRISAGTALIILALLAVVAGLLPVPQKEEYHYKGNVKSLVSVPMVPHISESDLVNTGDLYELTELPGVGETIAGLICEERESNGLFMYPEDLLAVKGIGEKKLEKIRPFLITEQDGSED